MIKLTEILSEAKRIKLEPEVLQTLKNVVELIFKRRKKGFRTLTPITLIPITVAEGTKGSVEIVIDPSLEYYGILDTKGEDYGDPNDFILRINPRKIKSKKGLYQTLYHEIMHATDPTFSVKHTEKHWGDYDPDIDEKYYGHRIEFVAYTNEFIEGLINEFKLRRKRLTNPKSIEALSSSLNNILNYFAKGEPLSSLSTDIILNMVGNDDINTGIRKTLDNILIDFPEISDMFSSSKEKLTYIEVLDFIKKYNPEDWNKFLSMLYNGVNEIKEFM